MPPTIRDVIVYLKRRKPDTIGAALIRHIITGDDLRATAHSKRYEREGEQTHPPVWEVRIVSLKQQTYTHNTNK